MAGKYKRFRLFGNRIPKYLLPLGSGTMLSEVIKQLKKSEPNCKIYLIANRNDQIFYPIVKCTMEKYDVNSKNLLYIDDTSSQLETAVIASELIPSNTFSESIAFANIDTILFNRSNYFKKLNECKFENGFLDTFIGENKDYSYVRVDEKNKVLDIVDKSIISNNACSGLYGFGSFSFFLKQAKELLNENGEANFTNIYNKYIKIGCDVHTQIVREKNYTVVLGTPEEYLINIHKFK